jgi:hypothetical protein
LILKYGSFFRLYKTIVSLFEWKNNLLQPPNQVKRILTFRSPEEEKQGLFVVLRTTNSPKNPSFEDCNCQNGVLKGHYGTKD